MFIIIINVPANLVELRQKPAAKPVMTSYMCERKTDGFLWIISYVANSERSEGSIEILVGAVVDTFGLVALVALYCNGLASTSWYVLVG